MPVNEKRLHALNGLPDKGGPVLYWMSREQRAGDNWGLHYARELAGEFRSLVVCFCLVPSFLGATLRQYDFMLRGLKETAEILSVLGIPFALRIGDPGIEIPRLAAEINAGIVVTDFDPLRVKQDWQKRAARALDAALIEVDGHNIVPARMVSDKQEYAARTIRPKIQRLFYDFLEEYPELTRQEAAAPDVPRPDWDAARRSIDVDETVGPVDTVPGEAAANRALARFIGEGLKGYAEKRNDPNAGATSRLSAYFHFGQIAPQRVALALSASGVGVDQEVFLEEFVVRRELSDNFCLHNPHYDSLKGAPEWARKALAAHAGDVRDYVYTREQFEKARTHSRFWNAAQNELRCSGYMHGYMRMYWAKKILQWSASPEEALNTALALNDRYGLDGRDPNGYVGVLWSIAGLHDRPWRRRPVFGTVRYMNEKGCRRKFDVDAYVARWG